LESKASALETPSYFNQSRPNLKVWTPMRLNLRAVKVEVRWVNGINSEHSDSGCQV